MKCENSNRTLHQLIPEAIVEEEPIHEIQKRKVRLSTKSIQTTPEEKKKYATAQAQTIAVEKVQVSHQQVQTELDNSDIATSPIINKFTKQEKDLNPKIEQVPLEAPQEHADNVVHNSKQRITRSTTRLANVKQEDAEKVIAFKRLTLDSDDPNAEQVIYEVQTENEQDMASFDALDDEANQIDADEMSETDQTAYFVLSDYQGNENVTNYDVAYDSENIVEGTAYNENVNEQQEESTREDFNFTIINPGEEGEEQIAPVVAATILHNNLAIGRSLKNHPHLSSTTKKSEFNCPECPIEFVSVSTLKRHCLKMHAWSVDEVNGLDGTRLNVTEKKPSKRKSLLTHDDDIGDIILPPEVEKAIALKLEVDRNIQQVKKKVLFF